VGSIRTLTDATAGLAKVRAVTVDLPHNPHHLRSDALDNRERILDAARAAFAALAIQAFRALPACCRRPGTGRTVRASD
jgi:hypothetical protein